MRFTCRALAAALAVIPRIAATADPLPQSPPASFSAGGGAYDQLPELVGVVSWKTLAKVTTETRKGRVVPAFSSDVMALNAKQIRLQGYMMPLDVGEQQSHFVLAAVSPGCPGCAEATTEMLVEVRATTPIKFSVNPVVVRGKFVLLEDDPNGLYYRLTEAVPSAGL
jgi:hypothetical protein